METVILKKIDRRMVIFIDEIDTVLELDFTDDFFAAIRSLHEARAHNAALQRLSFVLIGTATPNELIHDRKRTPFNIGRRVELTDFTREQLAPFLETWSAPPETKAEVLDRIYYWADGHPFLTQRICARVYESNRIAWTAGDIDELIEDLFFNENLARDKNIAAVEKRLLRFSTTPDVSSEQLLSVYRETWEGRRIMDDAQLLVHAHLKLAGVVKVVDQRLVVRNRIYHRAFNPGWIRKNRTDAQIRRLLVRAVQIAVAAIVIAGVLLMLSILAYRNSIEAQAMRQDAEQQRRLALSGGLAALSLLGSHAPQSARLPKDLVLLLAVQSRRLAATARSASAVYYAKSSNPRLVKILKGHSERVSAVAFAPDGKTIASGSSDGAIILWDVSTGQPRFALRVGPLHPVSSIAFHPHASLIAGAFRLSPAVFVWDLSTDPPMYVRIGDHPGDVTAIAFSPDGRMIASGCEDDTVRLWDLATNSLSTEPLRGHSADITSVAFADGTRLASGSADGTVILWEIASGKRLGQLGVPEKFKFVWSIAFAPDGSKLAVTKDLEVQIWDPWDERKVDKLGWGSYAAGRAVAWRADGKQLAYPLTRLEMHNAIRIGDPSDIGHEYLLQGHSNEVISLGYSRDGKWLASGSLDNTVLIWDVATDSRNVAAITLGSLKEEI